MTKDLRALGLQAGDTVMLHVSIKAIGWIVGGPDMVLQSIIDVISTSGTLMMLVSWEESTYDLERWSEDRRQAYLEECPPFDPATSRARTREMGVLPEYLRTWPGAFRSGHPVTSFAAFGARAGWLTHDHPMNYPNGSGSPLDKLCQAGGKVLSLGAPLETLTVLHYAENLARVPTKRVVRFQAPVLRDGEPVWITIEDFDSSTGIVSWEGEDYFRVIGREAIAADLATQGRVGGAESYLFDAKSLVDFGVAWLERTFGANQESHPG